MQLISFLMLISKVGLQMESAPPLQAPKVEHGCDGLACLQWKYN